MIDVITSYRLVDHGDRIALHQVEYRNGKPSAIFGSPVSFTTEPDKKHDLLAEMTLAYACANDLPPIAAADLTKIEGPIGI